MLLPRRACLAIVALTLGVACGAVDREANEPRAREEPHAEALPQQEELPLEGQRPPTPASAGPNWETIVTESDMWDEDATGHEWLGGGTTVQFVRPVDLRAPEECQGEAPSGRVPRLQRRDAMVGPIPILSFEIVRRVLRRDEAVQACAAECVRGTDLFEIYVNASGTIQQVDHRARTHNVSGRSACLAQALQHVRFPAIVRAPLARVVLPIRVRPDR